MFLICVYRTQRSCAVLKIALRSSEQAAFYSLKPSQDETERQRDRNLPFNAYLARNHCIQ